MPVLSMFQGILLNPLLRSFDTKISLYDKREKMNLIIYKPVKSFRYCNITIKQNYPKRCKKSPLSTLSYWEHISENTGAQRQTHWVNLGPKINYLIMECKIFKIWILRHRNHQCIQCRLTFSLRSVTCVSD